MNTTIFPVIDLPFLAREINDAHRQVVFHGKSMLMEAKRAGEALLAAKKEVQHGGFKAWIKENCGCSYESAKEYMRVSKLSKGVDLHLFEGGIRAFLDAHVNRPEEPAPAPREFTRADAERTLKLHALAERGATEGEQSAASSKTPKAVWTLRQGLASIMLRTFRSWISGDGNGVSGRGQGEIEIGWARHDGGGSRPERGRQLHVVCG